MTPHYGPWHMRAKLGAAALVFGVAACLTGGAAQIPIAGPTDVARGAQRFPDLTADELAEGRTVLLGRCATCHLPPAPTSRAPEAWPAQVSEMRARAHLDDRQHRAVERFLVTMSTATAQSVSGSSR